MGTDWESYSNYFLKNSTLDDFLSKDDGTFETGFRYANYIIKQLSDSYTFALFCFGTFIFVIYYRFIQKFSLYPFISLLLCFVLYRGYIFFTRQQIALMFCIIAFTFLYYRKIFRFVFFTLLASTFHSSAIICLFLYPLCNFHKLSIARINWITIGGCVAALSLGLVVVNYIIPFLPPLISYKLNKYFEMGDDMMMGISVAGILFNGIVNRGFFFLLFYRASRKFSSNTVFRFFYSMYCISLVMFFLTGPINVGLTRMVFYFDISQDILITYYFRCIKNKGVMLLVIGFYLFVRLFTNTLMGYYKDCFIPIKTIFDYI